MMYCRTLRFGKMDLAFPKRRVPDIWRVGCDVEIAAQQNVAAFFAGLVEKLSEPLQPIELEFELDAPQLRAVRDISIDGPDAFDGRSDETLLRFSVIIGKVLLNILGRIFGTD